MSFTKKWSLEIIRDGFERFEKEHGHYPKTPDDIDDCDYLPSRRQIQRIFGGLPQLRTLLGLRDIYLSKGVHRSKIGLNSNRRSRISEDNLRDILFKKFHEPFVHLEKPIDTVRKLRADFYVYNPLENFAIDVFATETYHNLETNIYIKLQKYSHLKLKLYFVLVSEELTAGDVDLFNSRKSSKFPPNIRLVTFGQFLEIIEGITVHPDPTQKVLDK